MSEPNPERLKTLQNGTRIRQNKFNHEDVSINPSYFFFSFFIWFTPLMAFFPIFCRVSTSYPAHLSRRDAGVKGSWGETVWILPTPGVTCARWRLPLLSNWMEEIWRRKLEKFTHLRNSPVTVVLSGALLQRDEIEKHTFGIKMCRYLVSYGR